MSIDKSLFQAIMRVVIDTNILISGADDESSYSFKIIKAVIEGRLLAFATHRTMGENRQILRKLVKDREYRQLLEDFFRKLKIVKFHNSSHPPLILRRGAPFLNVREGEGELPLSDPEDIKLFESAKASQADYIISEDREVLAVGDYEGTEVITAQDFWTKYESENNDDSTWKDWGEMILGK